MVKLIAIFLLKSDQAKLDIIKFKKIALIKVDNLFILLKVAKFFRNF